MPVELSLTRRPRQLDVWPVLPSNSRDHHAARANVACQDLRAIRVSMVLMLLMADMETLDHAEMTFSWDPSIFASSLSSVHVRLQLDPMDQMDHVDRRVMQANLEQPEEEEKLEVRETLVWLATMGGQDS
jgi:hypothetical protein